MVYGYHWYSCSPTLRGVTSTSDVFFPQLMHFSRRLQAEFGERAA
jgi:hypothetical protein